MTVFALLQARDEERYLHGWLANVEPFVDGIVALDDGSRDTTPEMLAAHPKVVEVMHKPPGGDWDERGNHMALIKAGRRHGASWFLCLDADERVERRFGRDIRRLVERARTEGIDAYALRLCELWGDRRHYRVDGVWGSKTRYRFFRNDPDHRKFDPRPLHRTWMPLEIAMNLERVGRPIDYNLYHLRMIEAVDRAARHARYTAMDPTGRFQKNGYDYLIDETGLRLAQVPADRDFLPADEGAVERQAATVPAEEP